MAEWASHCYGDILDYADKVDVIAHQVNCQGIMSGGLALQIKDKWPGVYKAYRNLIRNIAGEEGLVTIEELLGCCQFVPTDNCTVANLFGQYDVGAGRQTDYTALLKALKTLCGRMKGYGFTSAAFPFKLGCGLAGGDWEVVSALIKGAFEGSGISITIVEYVPEDSY